MADATDTYPVWTVRFTWRVTDAKDQPVHSYRLETDESRAIDRAVFVMDHYDSSDVRELVCVHVKRPDGTWSEVPRSNTRLSAPTRFAFQLPPFRPA
jgi:hypothetical protein